LAVEGIGRDDGVLEREHGQEPRHRGDLVRLAVDRELPQDQPLLDRPGAHQMQRRGGSGPVEGAAWRLAVERHHAARAGPGEALHERQEAGPELRRVEQPEDAAEGVVAGNTVRQGQDLGQERPLGTTEQGHVGAARAATQERAQGD
jgi:hypothetical protein